MLRHPTLAALEALKLTGTATARTEQLEMPEVQRLSFEERLGLLVDSGADHPGEWTTDPPPGPGPVSRQRHAGGSRLWPSAPPQTRHRLAGDRGVDPAVMTIRCSRAPQARATRLAGALAQNGRSAGLPRMILRLPRFSRELAIAQGDGRYGRLLRSLAEDGCRGPG